MVTVDLPELTGGEKVCGPLFDVLDSNIKAGADDTALYRGEDRDEEAVKVMLNASNMGSSGPC